MRESQGDGWIGRPLKRREDHRLLTGAGAFVDDMTPPGCLHVALLRSPHAHARIAHLDVEPARQAPRTLLVVTGKDVAHLAPMPVARLVPDMRVPPHPILAESQVHAVGMPVAAVVAEDVYAAYDALDLIAVDYEPLPGLAEPEAALASGASAQARAQATSRPSPSTAAKPATKPAKRTSSPPAPDPRKPAVPAAPVPAVDSGPKVLINREVFSYDGDGRRDPFVSLLTTSDLKPLLTDLKLVGVAYDPRGQNSVAVLRDITSRDQYKVRVGQTIGRMRVAAIQPKAVIFTIEEFGYSRQELLPIAPPDSSKMRLRQ